MNDAILFRDPLGMPCAAMAYSSHLTVLVVGCGYNSPGGPRGSWCPWCGAGYAAAVDAGLAFRLRARRSNARAAAARRTLAQR